MFCVYILSKKVSSGKHKHTFGGKLRTNSGSSKAFLCCGHVFHNQYISDQAVLFILNQSPCKRTWLPLSSWIFVMEINTQAVQWRGIQNYQWLTLVGHTSFTYGIKPDSYFFPFTTYFLLPLSIKLPTPNLTIWPFTSLKAHNSWSS